MRLPLILVCTLGLAGCIGSLDNPELFTGCNVEAVVFGNSETASRSKCGLSGCHGPVMTQAGLDLVSPGVAQRLLTQKSTCGDGGIPLATFILEKSKANPSCGEAMPYGVTTGLSPDHFACLQQYIRTITDGGVQ